MAKRYYENRYQYLLSRYFTPLEARELSVLPERTPALQALIHARQERRGRFEHLASTKIAKGRWHQEDIPQKWVNNLARLYSVRNWRVQEGPRGRQRAMRKNDPNPWAMYRAALKLTPPPDYVSPWQLRQMRGRGGITLQRDLIRIQTAEKKGMSRSMIQHWVAEKERAVERARGQRKEQLTIELRRLERLLA